MGVKLRNGIALKKRLLALPEANWTDEDEWWDSLLIVPTRKQHDSGFAQIAFIGVRINEAKENIAEMILGYPDAIQFPAWSGIPGRQHHPTLHDYGGMRADAYWPSGIIRLFSRDWQFQADCMSDVEIKLRPRKEVS